MTSINMLLKKRARLESNIIKWQQIISSSPEGSLISRKRSNGQFEYSYSENDNKGHEHYINQANMELAHRLAMRDYARHRLADAEYELKALNKYIRNLTEEKKADAYLRQHPGAAKLIMNEINSKEEYIRKWLQEEYTRNTNHPEGLKYPTIVPGLLVRSKSEADIISLLNHYNIPFRYEEEIIVNGIVFHPDITCLNLTTLDKFYIEHQGGWDKPEYVNKLPNREILLARAGIVPWQNLIITTETYDHPLDIKWVDTIINFFLL